MFGPDPTFQGTVFEKRVTELSLSEFLNYGPQQDPQTEGNCLLRKTKDGKIVNWNVEIDDRLCTLEEAFQKVESSLGFNIELKFDDHIVYDQSYLTGVLQAILHVGHLISSLCYCFSHCFYFSWKLSSGFVDYP